MRVAAVILAGGRGSRLSADRPKPLVELRGRPLVAHVLDRLALPFAPILISAADPAAFAGLDLPIVSDRVPDFQGPLAGLDAAAAFLRREEPGATHLLSLPGDTPFLPPDIAARLGAAGGEGPRLASFAGRLQPVAALWPLPALDELADHLSTASDRSLLGFAHRFGFEDIPFAPSAEAPRGDPFFNVNTPEELAEARAWISR
ncbi:molybdenum cofactor guanylyltransferase [Aureimonas endophytica]|uniref:Molybdenum cofactor guanylyltransferase n=1 Tax=Aureimonas endophytica TaxID=2027858 RepID=A0A917DZ96_9HYPH|nr:molybdenum cofactor guanylyltransferase [Aureimonas endophytica]GGD86747.1 molybdenum cofactor guanylyltransferase [Aureimonas endophytica]